jgi:hypothetical protein
VGILIGGADALSQEKTAAPVAAQAPPASIQAPNNSGIATQGQTGGSNSIINFPPSVSPTGTPPWALPRQLLPVPLTLQNLFDTDFPGQIAFKGADHLDITVDWGTPGEHELSAVVQYLVLRDSSVAHKKSLAYFINSNSETDILCAAILQAYQDSLRQGDARLQELEFSGRIYIYTESALSSNQVAKLQSAFSDNHIEVQFRGPEYLMAHSNEARLAPPKCANSNDEIHVNSYNSDPNSHAVGVRMEGVCDSLVDVNSVNGEVIVNPPPQ